MNGGVFSFCKFAFMHLTNLKVKADKELRKLKSADFPKHKVVRGKSTQTVVPICKHLSAYRDTQKELVSNYRWQRFD